MKKGSMLLELVMALGISVVVLVAVAQSSLKSVSNAGFSKRQTEATTYATQGMEWIRQQKNSLGWEQFYTLAGTASYCLKTLGWSSGCGTIGGGSSLTRMATFTRSAGPPQQVTAVVTVSWEEASKTFSAKQTTVFANY